jgi:hypothetical protein
MPIPSKHIHLGEHLLVSRLVYIHQKSDEAYENTRKIVETRVLDGKNGVEQGLLAWQTFAIKMACKACPVEMLFPPRIGMGLGEDGFLAILLPWL